MDIKILVAAHKKYQMPEDDIYLPIHVGSENKEEIGFIRDCEGVNISNKNPYYCELTALYWAWKNMDNDYIGLCHYRRYFSCKKKIPKKESEKFKVVINREEAEKILQSVDIVLPKKRNYYIESIYSHYKHTMYVEPLDITGKIILEKYPKYYPEFEKLKKISKMHAFNMFIMKKEILNRYCEWLFDILFELENRVEFDQYDSFHARFFGRISERLLDVWLRTEGLKYKEVRVIDMQNINWWKKGTSFLKAKFWGKKYEKSF